jgi:hypothetical protein
VRPFTAEARHRHRRHHQQCRTNQQTLAIQLFALLQLPMLDRRTSIQRQMGQPAVMPLRLLFWGLSHRTTMTKHTVHSPFGCRQSPSRGRNRAARAGADSARIAVGRGDVRRVGPGVGPSASRTVRPKDRAPMAVPYSIAPVLSSVAGRSVWPCLGLTR